MPKPKLTPEQKKALQAEKRAEKKKLAELKYIKNKHDHLSREVKYGQLTLLQHEKNWKKMLVHIALPRMRQDLELAWHNFERVIDSKDFTISLLMDEISDADEQYMLNLKCHAENIDKLILKFKDRLDELKAENEAEITSMQDFSDKELNEIREVAAESEDYLKTMLFGLEVAKKEQEKLVRGEYLSKIDEECSKYADILQNLKVGLEKSFSNIWYETRRFIDNQINVTADKRKAYNILYQQDTALQGLCSEHTKKLARMQEYIKTLKTRFKDLQETEGQKIYDLLHERQYFADAFWTLRNRLAADRALDTTNLETLTVQSNEAAEYLKNIEIKGERILALAAICRKLETIEEKIVQFRLEASDKLSNSFSDIRLDEYKNITDLHHFWQRTAQADAIRYSINEEREFLKRENTRLKARIHYYCECLDCDANYSTPKEVKLGGTNIVDGNQLCTKFRAEQ